ncbi:MFS transporter [Granulibacter bethesdensis]|uniref:Antimicrobial peptide efflux protein rosa n=1 Tax=Granulibacter bethesdensis (strain ATCC BAA-1260 / CGDNIH1) TaxID=391165 RepID=Q0BSU8_GRABC|nr:Antimicrobial peptide efflux protein rosa [Granulibacter bethesdensis CGDNIH1]AHJ68996.1 Antimicrobial peptide efflux protein rosa [Granulibacter bethesdensis]APH51929.1 Antimicrobial peptide efflux protein rosa [Granulibacter bethesdensis]APH64619.1 Antimicrobial peptide efflux protein rosa [Granulibacter bethesdensis]
MSGQITAQPATLPGGNTTETRNEGTVFAILIAISISHMLNDMLQSLLPAVYPILKTEFSLQFRDIGLLTLTYQMTGSILQPLIGLYTDRKPKPFSLAFGMGCTLIGLYCLSIASGFNGLLAGAAIVGLGSSIFHPESSRVARLASGGRHGFAQSLFQVGGNAGAAIGPLLAAFIVLPHGRYAIGWFCAAALLGVIILTAVGRWYGAIHRQKKRVVRHTVQALPRAKIALAMTVLCALVFSKYFYMASFTSYYTFYLIHHFGVSVQSAQLYLFLFLGAVAAGTFAGGPIGDRIGRKYVIWFSILGVLPFTLILPHASLAWTAILSVAIGLILSSAFAAIVVYGQELLPGNVGAVAGLFFGLAFGMGGIGAALLGWLADKTSIETVYGLCAWLPAFGILAVFLPDLERRRY